MPARGLHEQPVSRIRFRQAPLAAAAVWFAAGIGVEHLHALHFSWAPLSLLCAGLAALLLLAVVALRRALRVAWMPVAAIWLAIGMAAAMFHPAPAAPAQLLSYADNLSRAVRGRVVRVRVPPPRPEAQAADADQVPPWEASEDTAPTGGRGGPLLSVDLAVDEVEDVTPDTAAMVPVAGGVRVSIFGEGAPALHCGDELEMPLRLKTPDRYRDPGAFDYAGQLLAQGIAARSSLAAAKVQVLRSGKSTLPCRLAAAQAWASARLVGFADSPENRRMPSLLRLERADAEMLNAMLFGDRTGLSHSLRVGFERTGSFHLFVVSGMHIALLAGGVFWLLRWLRLPPWAATLLTVVAATSYALLTGFGQPAQRALGMTSVFLLARLLSREHDVLPLNALGAAALAMLVWAPASMFDASFQMTVLAIVAIAGIAIPLGDWTFLRYVRLTREVFARHGNRLRPREAQFRMMLELWGQVLAELLGRWALRLPARVVRVVLLTLELSLIATVAELVMVLPMAIYFHRAAVFALPANMLVVPLITLLVPAAVLTFLAALANSWLALLPGGVTALLLHGITAGIRLVSHLQAADVRIPGPAWWVSVLAFAGWGLCCWMVRRGRWPALGAAVLVPLIAVALLWPEPLLLHAGRLEVTAIDVGQGDSLLAVSPEGSTMLIDAGGPVGGFGGAEVVAGFDVGEQVVSPYLWSRRLRRVDIVVLSHAHTDHMGGMPAVLENFRPRELWVGSDPHSPLYAALLAQAARLGILVRHVRAGDHMAWGGVQVAVLGPTRGYTNAGAPKNDDSVVLHMQYGKASALLEGDAERPSEDAMLAAGLAGPVTLLKVGHHGSRTSTNPEFVAAVHATDAVISVGRHNTFGHPRGEVIGRLAEAGTRLFRTDEFGLTTFLLAPDGTVREFSGEEELTPGASNAAR